jgi:predicted short-subunit dehydrogenase-like oxidoreductase (DUF2520 family)
MPSALDAPFRALVIGVNRAIGKAFVAALQVDTQCTQVSEVSRSHGIRFDLQDTRGLQAQAAACAAHRPYHLIVDATGALTIDGVGPEKSLSALQTDSWPRHFKLTC